MRPGGLSPSSCARSQRCRRVIPVGYRGLSRAGWSPGPPGQTGEPGVLTGAGSVFPGEVEAPQHLHERRVRRGLRGGAGTVPLLQLHLVLVLVLLVLEPARGPPRAPPPPPREGVGDAPGLLHGPARHGAGTAPPIPGTARDPPLPGTSGRDPPLPMAGRKRRGRAGEPDMGTLGRCHPRGCPCPPPPSAPAGCPRVLSPPVLSLPAAALSPPRQFLAPRGCCHLHPSVPCSPGTVTRVSDCHPQALPSPSCAHYPLVLSPLSPPSPPALSPLWFLPVPLDNVTPIAALLHHCHPPVCPHQPPKPRLTL